MALIRGALLAIARACERLRNTLLYAAAGTMTVRELRAAIVKSWADFNDSDLDIHSGLMGWEQSFVDRFIGRGDRVLLVGSGTGRDLLALIGAGCAVVGVEPSRRASAVARRVVSEHGAKAPIVDGYFEDVELPGMFDAIVFSNFCYSYIPGSARRVDALVKARRLLVPAGRIIVSFLFRDDPPRGRVIAIGRMAGALSGSDWRMEPGDAIARGGIEPPGLGYEHMFGPGEIEREAEAAGLSVAGRGGHPHHEPWIVFVPASRYRASSVVATSS